MSQIKNLFLSLRPSQWLKNLAVFAAIFFGGNLFDSIRFGKASWTFVAFCFLASSIYLLNDLFDADADRVHELKRKRPIAAGLVNKNLAFATSIVFAILALSLGGMISKGVLASLFLYLLVQLAYTLYLKKVILLELLVIALGFMIRVFAGSFASQTSLSSWLILTVMMLSLFLAIGKRRSETTLLGEKAAKHRSTLSQYPLTLLDGLVFMSATASLLTYSLFTFNQPTFRSIFTQYLPLTLASPKWLMVTIPFVVYGIFRYLYLIFEKKEGDSPEKILLTDKTLLVTVLFWLLLSGVIIYFLPTY